MATCNDVIVNEDDTQITSMAQDNDSSGDDCEMCSPFCQCHCCHVHTINFDLNAFEPLSRSFLQEDFAYFDSHGKEISRSLLQPPKV